MVSSPCGCSEYLCVAKWLWPKVKCVMEQLAVCWDFKCRWKFWLDAPDACVRPQTLFKKSPWSPTIIFFVHVCVLVRFLFIKAWGVSSETYSIQKLNKARLSILEEMQIYVIYLFVLNVKNIIIISYNVQYGQIYTMRCILTGLSL